MAVNWEKFITLDEGSKFDISFNLMGNLLAISGQEGEVEILSRNFEEDEQFDSVAKFKAHKGPIWKIEWAHPKFGNILSTCSYDQTVKIWMMSDHSQSEWTEWYGFEGHTASVNGLCFGRHDLGFKLVTCSTDGYVSLINDSNVQEDPLMIKVANSALNSVSFLESKDTVSEVKVLTGGASGALFLVSLLDSDPQVEQMEVCPHTEVIRDIRSSPSLVGRTILVASVSDDKVLALWEYKQGAILLKQVKNTKSTPWRISWTLTGHVCIVHCKDGVEEFSLNHDRSSFE